MQFKKLIRPDGTPVWIATSWVEYILHATPGQVPADADYLRHTTIYFSGGSHQVVIGEPEDIVTILEA